MYECKLCNYCSSKKSNYERHNISKKHMSKVSSSGKIKCNHCNKWLNKNSMIYHKKYVCIENDVSLYSDNNKNISNESTKYNNRIENIAKSPNIKKDIANSIIDDKSIYRIKELEERLKIAEEAISVKQKENEILKIENYMHEKYIKILSKSELFINPNIFDNNHGTFMLSNNQYGMTLSQFLTPITEKEETVLENNWLNGSIDYVMNRYLSLKPYEKPFYCTDHSRKTFIYKDDHGLWRKDHKGVQICYLIANKICKFYKEKCKNANNWIETQKYIEFQALTFNNFSKKVFYKERNRFYIKNVVKVIDK